jgi:hypothetical protein
VIEAGPFALPVYLSQLYLGSEDALVPAFKWRHFLDVDVRTMSLAVQVLLGAGILLAWLMRPRGALLSWVAVFMALTIVEDIAMFLGFQPVLRPVLPYLVAFVPGRCTVWTDGLTAMMGIAGRCLATSWAERPVRV